MLDNFNKTDTSSPKSHDWGFTFYEETFVSNEMEEIDVESPDLSRKSFPLAMANVGESLHIVKLKGSEGMVRRLIGMGLVPGAEVQIISCTGGSVVLGIGDNRIGLGVGMAQKIMCSHPNSDC